MTLGQEIVREARKWLGTPFHHQGRLCGDGIKQPRGGVDCLGLLIGAADGAGAMAEGKAFSEFDSREYGHLPDANALQGVLQNLLECVELQDIQSGDVLLMRFDGNPQHLAIVTDYEGGFGIIHAFAPARKVIEHMFDESWEKLVFACFRVKPAVV